MKFENLINKFKSGNKLTRAELEYLAKKSPELYQKAIRILEERKVLEERLRTARTKEGTTEIITISMAGVQKSSGDEFEVTAKANHLSKAYAAYLTGKEEKAESENITIDFII